MHSTVEIEEKIRKRYHQPKGVEQFGIEPVPTELRTKVLSRIQAVRVELEVTDFRAE